MAQPGPPAHVPQGTLVQPSGVYMQSPPQHYGGALLPTAAQAPPQPSVQACTLGCLPHQQPPPPVHSRARAITRPTHTQLSYIQTAPQPTPTLYPPAHSYTQQHFCSRHCYHTDTVANKPQLTTTSTNYVSPTAETTISTVYTSTPVATRPPTSNRRLETGKNGGHTTTSQQLSPTLHSQLVSRALRSQVPHPLRPQSHQPRHSTRSVVVVEPAVARHGLAAVGATNTKSQARHSGDLRLADARARFRT